MLKALSYVLPHSSPLSSSEQAPNKVREGNCHQDSQSGGPHAFNSSSGIKVSPSPSLGSGTILSLSLLLLFFNTAQGNHGLSRVDTMAVNDYRKFEDETVVCLNSFGGHEAFQLRQPWL